MATDNFILLAGVLLRLGAVIYEIKRKKFLFRFKIMETEIAVEHPKFDGYSYKFKIL
jgi:hypothetical protein